MSVFVALTALATNQLYVLSAHTDAWFAWTILPPITAAFLGAGYAAGCLLMVLALRSGAWAYARVPVLTVVVFAWLTLVATLLHLDRFHFGAAGLVAHAAAWFWLAVYVVVPPALTALAIAQEREAGRDPAPGPPAPGWLVAAFAAQGLLMCAIGAVLFVTPGTADTVWPWRLTPLTARVVAAWLIAFGVAAVLALRRRDLDRLASGAAAYTLFGVLQLVAVARFGLDAGPLSIAYVVLMASVVAVGATGTLAAARGRRRAAADATPAAAGPAG